LEQKGHNLPVPLPTKVELIKMVKNLNFKKKIIIDDMIDAAGHEILRLPPYHSIFSK